MSTETVQFGISKQRPSGLCFLSILMNFILNKHWEKYIVHCIKIILRMRNQKSYMPRGTSSGRARLRAYFSHIPKVGTILGIQKSEYGMNFAEKRAITRARRTLYETTLRSRQPLMSPSWVFDSCSTREDVVLRDWGPTWWEQGAKDKAKDNGGAGRGAS